MKKTILVDHNDIVYCSRLEDGRIEKVLLKKYGTTIYVCEECEATWLSLDGIFTENDATSFELYLESVGLICEGVMPEWDSIVDNLGFICVDEIVEIIERYGVGIVRI